MFQAHFFMEIGQGRFGSFGVLRAPVHEEAHADASEHAQDPDGVAMAHTAAILVGTNIQTLVQSSFDAPIITLRVQPLAGRQSLRPATRQQILGLGLVAQTLTQNDRALGRSGKARLLWGNEDRAEGTVFFAALFCRGPVCAQFSGNGYGGGKLLRFGQFFG